MRKLAVMGAFFAVLAFCSLAVASASATVWLKEGQTLGKATLGTTHETLVFVNKSPFGTLEVECSGLFVGTFGPGGEDSISEIVGLAGEKPKVTCKTIKGITFAGNCETGKLTLVEAVNLSWHTSLTLHTEGTTWDKIEPGASTKPGYKIFCEGIAGTIECRSSVTESKWIGNGVSGAKFEFRGKEGALAEECSNGGEGTILGKGEVLGFTVS